MEVVLENRDEAVLARLDPGERDVERLRAAVEGHLLWCRGDRKCDGGESNEGGRDRNGDAGSLQAQVDPPLRDGRNGEALAPHTGGTAACERTDARQRQRQAP